MKLLLKNRLSDFLSVLAVAALLWERPGETQQRPLPAPLPQIEAALARCTGCHSGNAPKGGLDLTRRDTALKGGVSGPAFIPGQPEKSPLWQRIAAKQMPPDSPLAPAEIALLRRWIANGAVWPVPSPEKQISRPASEWWALRKLTRPPIPAVQSPKLASRRKPEPKLENPLDAFVLAELQKRGLSFAPPADRRTLIRRATFDLLGVPPTPQEIDAFLADRHPSAYEALLDRLLADPRYGERWGRHWLDVARFGESQGFERDKIRDHAWRYRDYVIDAFNRDKPYDQFVKEQIAGDVLEPVTSESIVATGFLVAAPWDEVGQTQQSEVNRKRVREEEMEEMVGTVGQTFLGMTVNCARCHDHKFDPIPSRDYYRLRAALDGVRSADRPLLPPADRQQQAQRKAQIQKQLAALEQERYALEQTARQRLNPKTQRPPSPDAPVPLAQWTFETDGRDQRGSLHATLEGGATIANGRLHLNGNGAYAIVRHFPQEIHAKTLEAWVVLPERTQRGGGVISLQSADGQRFDAIVFGEREPQKWMAGSNSFVRTRDLAAPEENGAPDQPIHIAITYQADGTITLYRNGVPYAAAYRPDGDNAALQTYPANGAQLLFGLRHIGAGNGFLTGEIEEARLYDRAMTAAEVAASFRAGVSAVSAAELRTALTPEERQRTDTLRAEAERLRNALQMQPTDALVYAVAPSQPEPAHLLLRGDVESKGETVTPGGLSCIRWPSADFGLPSDAPEAERRRKLAEWIAHPDNPLTWRVIVNRVWHGHFGRGLVASPNDFGVNGERPTHPALLDWLAKAFCERSDEKRVMSDEKTLITHHSSRITYACHSSLKRLHKLIMLSRTYRQSSQYNAKAAAQDAEDRSLWRFAPRRLEGEAVRDAMLCVSGQINYQRGGPGFRPFTVTINNSHFYTLTDPETPDFNRRTIYRISVQSAKSPFLDTLDCPDPSTKTPRRAVTTTPLQALELMNSRFVQRQAHQFAARLRKEAGEKLSEQVALAYRLAFGRSPTAAESRDAAVLAHEHGLENLCWALLNTSEFLYMK